MKEEQKNKLVNIVVFLVSKKKPVEIEIETKYPSNFLIELEEKLKTEKFIKIGSLLFKTDDISYIVT